MKTDFLIIGSGLAGLTSALTLKDFGKVLVVSKGALADSSTALAQGGIAAVVEKDDSFESHIRDTLVAGAYHNDKKIVEILVRGGPGAIDWLQNQGVVFDRKSGNLSPSREAAHSKNRILHVTDFTGRAIETALLSKARKETNIRFWEHSFTLDLITRNKTCFGALVVKNGKVRPIFSRGVILATGGLGQIYEWTTNPTVATGDGVAMAYRAGAKIKDLEFIQFHPTALAQGKSPLFLLSEALRGEGAYLLNGKRERFMNRYDPRLELAPRDIVARAIWEEQKKGPTYLDISHKDAKHITSRFPNIYKELKTRGFDLTHKPVPVTPAAHYSCGGVRVDEFGRTTIPNLFAFGEVACTGVHGANRLASNSLLEAVVFPLRLPKIVNTLPIQIKTFALRPLSFICHPPDNKERNSIRRLMWKHVGIVRQTEDLQKALQTLVKLEAKLKKQEKISASLAETTNMLMVARLITKAAVKRKKSLGAHYISSGL